MANDELAWFEAAMGAVSKINSEEDHDLGDARCPKCDASGFVRISDLYPIAVARLEEHPESQQEPREGGLTDLQIVERFRPPQRKSALRVVIPLVIVLSALSFYLYRRKGELPGEIALVAGFAVTMMAGLTTLRRYSDDHYHRRQRRNKLHMCLRCGQLVA
jgi:hypothetical protein